jgi:hypothetical protein
MTPAAPTVGAIFRNSRLFILNGRRLTTAD